jgi:hypothetical protein
MTLPAERGPALMESHAGSVMPGAAEARRVLKRPRSDRSVGAYRSVPTGGALMKRPKLTILLLALALVLAACNPGATSPPGGGGQPSGVTPSGPAPTTGIIPGY